MLSDDHLRALGRLAHNAADLENIIEVTLHELIDEDPAVGAALTANTGVSQMLDRVESLAELRETTIRVRENLVECVSAARRVLGERNHLLHSRWIVDDAENMTLQVRGKKLQKRVQLEVTVEDIEDAAGRLQVVATNLRIAWAGLVLALGRSEPMHGSSTLVLVPNRWRVTEEVLPSPSRSKSVTQRWVEGKITTAEYEEATGQSRASSERD